MPATLGQTVCNALIDTGATRSCLSEEYYQQLLLPGLNPVHRLLVQTASGGNLPNTGSVKCDFKLGEKHFSFNFIICKNLNRPCILGLDFLRKHRVGIGWSPNGKFKLDFHKQILVESIKVYMTGPLFTGQVSCQPTFMEPCGSKCQGSNRKTYGGRTLQSGTKLPIE